MYLDASDAALTGVETGRAAVLPALRANTPRAMRLATYEGVSRRLPAQAGHTTTTMVRRLAGSPMSSVRDQSTPGCRADDVAYHGSAGEEARGKENVLAALPTRRLASKTQGGPVTTQTLVILIVVILLLLVFVGYIVI